MLYFFQFFRYRFGCGTSSRISESITLAKTPRKIPLNPDGSLHYIDRGKRRSGVMNESDDGGAMPGGEDEDFGRATSRIGNSEQTPLKKDD